MKKKILLAAGIAMVMCICATGCEDDDKKVAADTIDALGNAANHIMDKAPSGEEIVNGVDGFFSSVGEIMEGASTTNDTTSNNDSQ